MSTGQRALRVRPPASTAALFAAAFSMAAGCAHTLETDRTLAFQVGSHRGPEDLQRRVVGALTRAGYPPDSVDPLLGAIAITPRFEHWGARPAVQVVLHLDGTVVLAPSEEAWRSRRGGARALHPDLAAELEELAITLMGTLGDVVAVSYDVGQAQLRAARR